MSCKKQQQHLTYMYVYVVEININLKINKKKLIITNAYQNVSFQINSSTLRQNIPEPIKKTDKQ